MNEFKRWDGEFRNQNFNAFNNDANALLWLKVRAVCRGKMLKKFLSLSKITLSSSKIADQNVELYNHLESMPNAMSLLDEFLRERNNEWYKSKGVNERQLKEDLYKVQSYAWGGDQNNSLDKHFVNRYVKVICHYDELMAKRDIIAENAWNYVQTSWYNNWTSYLIESLFKCHPNVVSAVGEIKSVDFFIGNIPVDLKVTYFPSQYMDAKFKEKTGKHEISWIKSKAKDFKITYDSGLTGSQLMYVLTEKLKEQECFKIIDEQRQIRRKIVDEVRQNPLELMRWLYENQGEMRFGAENRLFLILVDLQDMSESWKMKRSFSIIEPKVKAYLEGFAQDSLKRIDFEFKNKRYQSLADVIFIIREAKI